ncbi:signal transduction histidine kinase, nitrogen specific, NtrB [Halorhodospira halophila SL1]|uniref:histidine kinase n=2 Tax=Halorhodospira halophila TaxID=1053 RepID=A1WZN4_HALHL|nr:signal transduction histidine kinase, nitrogen specific, NtrB [Halorhodospira halophila SL1]MBK1729325.1 hypothetical protein [Halorhodospira halophila]
MAVRLGATFLLVTLMVALPLTLWFDHYARGMIEAGVERAVEGADARVILDAAVVSEAFDRVRGLALLVVGLSALLAAGVGALIAARWRTRMRSIVEQGHRRARRAQGDGKQPARCPGTPRPRPGEDELDAVERQLLNTVDQLGRSQWLLDSVEDLVMLVDADGTIRHGNAAIGTHCASCPVPDCMGATVPDLLGGGLWLRIRTGIERAETGTFEQEVRLDGRSWPALVSYRRLGELTLVKITDLSEYRRLNEHLEKLQALSTLGEMSTELAHDIKNSIVPVRLLCEVAPLEAEDRQAIFRSLDHIHELVNDFMAFGCGRSSEPRSGALTEILQSWTTVLRNEAQAKGVSLTAAFADARVELPGGFRIVYANLVRNAVQAVPAGGQVWVDARVDRRDTLVLQVADNGPGIPEALRERLFEPFATSRADGTGLGLPLVQRYVQEAGGEVVCDSTPGTGTSFTVHWPGAGETTGRTLTHHAGIASAG